MIHPDPKSYPVACLSNIRWETTVEGSKGKTYTVTYGRRYRGKNRMDYSCTCPAFDFRPDENGYCKHIYQVIEERCGWDEQLDDGDVSNDRCPKCGGPVYIDSRIA